YFWGQNLSLPRFCRSALRDFPGSFFHYIRRAFLGDRICALGFISLELSFDRDFHLAIRTFDFSFHFPIRNLQRFELGSLLSILIDKLHRATPLPLLVLAQNVSEFFGVPIISAVGAGP